MKRMSGIYLLRLFLLLPLSIHASATVITTELIHTGGSSWQAEYSLLNDSLATPVNEFTVFFDLGLYENLSVVATPVDWDPFVAQPDANIPDDGFYDAYSLGTGIASGDSLGGFTVSFDWLGLDDPGTQYFEILDPNTFDVLDSGQTLPSVLVDEPSSTLLLTLGVVTLLGRRMRVRRAIQV